MKLSASLAERNNMSQCYYCRWHNGGHNVGCPVHPVRDEVKLNRFKCGFDDYLEGKDYWSPDPSYMMGQGRGIVLREEQENGEHRY